MSFLQVDFTKPLFPPEETRDSFNKYGCTTCYNFHPYVALTTFPCGGLSIDDARNLTDELGEGSESPAAPSAWTGKYRADYVAVEYRKSLADIKEASESGCASCTVLREVIRTFSGGSFSPDDPDLEARVVFSRGLALRIFIRRNPSPETADDDNDEGIFGNLGPADLGDDCDIDDETGRPLGSYELYTLPGMCQHYITYCYKNNRTPRLYNSSATCVKSTWCPFLTYCL